MRSRLTTLLLSLGLALLAGCASPGVKAPARDSDVLTADTILKPAAPIAIEDGASGISISPKTDANRAPPKPEIEVGTANFYKPQATPSHGGGEGQVTFNFENQPVQAVVKAILGDMRSRSRRPPPAITISASPARMRAVTPRRRR